ncbi:MAG: polysaccharide deacetylase family protein [Cytophagales bacterium]|nr:polysaccharide deacetylase family protein [Cytophagales bacterium]
MKKIILILFISSKLLSQNQANNDIRLIIQADDIGFCHAVNRACIDVYKQGIARSVEVIVPSPWFMEAASMLAQNPGYDVGVHLCLTSEWTNIKWRPMTEAKTLRNPDGYFCPFIWPGDILPKNAGNYLLENKVDVAEVEKEFRAQIETAKKYIPQLSHLTGHMGCINATPEITEIVKKLAKEYGLYFGELNKTKYGGQWSGSDKSPEQKEAAFIELLKTLQPGNTYHVVEHPGYDVEEMQSILHKGYENVALDRHGVTKTWTSDKVKKVINERNIKLISVKEAYSSK